MSQKNGSVKSTRWRRVSEDAPCPVCGQGSWCSLAVGGRVVKCMREAANAFRTGKDRNGTPYYLHRRNGTTPPSDDPPSSGPEPQRADPDTLHAVYSALLDALSLAAADREALRRRGLPDDAIERGGYRTLPSQGRSRVAAALRDRFGDAVLRVPGFIMKNGENGPYLTLRGPVGLVVPCRGRAGRLVALKLRRADAGTTGPRYFYFSSAGFGGPGPGSPAHAPLGTPESAERVRLVEGELKADVAQSLTGLPTLSVPGVSTWRPALEVLEALGCKTVRLAFDADAWDKAHVARALSSCCAALLEAGFAVEVERWAVADGKGLDDLLLAGKTPEVLIGDDATEAVREALAAATADEPAESDELTRLHEVLNGGGAEALFRDKPLLQALAELARDDPAAFASVRASIRGRVSLRDLDRTLLPFRKQATPESGGESSHYFEERGSIHRNVQTKEGPVAVPLCNFTAKIVEDVVQDDGVERAAAFVLEGSLADGTPLPRAEVAGADFAGMNWVVPAWGTRAVVYAGQGTKDHLRAAIQLLSGDVPRRTVYRHVGWRLIEGAWLYLHAQGALGAAGLADVPVALPEPLAGYCLPEPPQGDELRQAVRASLGLLGLGPARLTFPVLSAVYRAVLGDADFGLHLAGPTGSFKSEAAALAQQHFGAGMDGRHLPANWSSTGNALEALAFSAKDALLVVDDYCPVGSASDVQRLRKEADRLFRGQGNHAGRQRLRSDASLRPAKPPRGLVLSTGEDVPAGQSLRARMLVLEVSPGDLGPLPPDPNPTLSACQRDARAGGYAAALAGFVRWLAGRYEQVRAGLRAEADRLRERASGAGQHARTPGIVADLALGLRYLLEFAHDVGAVSAGEQAELWRRGWEALGQAAEAQAAHIATAEPAALFIRLLSAAVASGSAHVADGDGNEPPEPQRWGWRPEGGCHREQGTRVGWLVEGDLYLEPDSSFAAAQQLARAQGEAFTVTPTTLRKRLKEKGLLASTDEVRGKLTVRRTLQGVRREVLHIAWGGPSPVPRTGPTGPDAPAPPEKGPIPWAENGRAPDQSAQQPAQESAHEHQGDDPVGRLGRSVEGGGAVTGAFHSSSEKGPPDPRPSPLRSGHGWLLVDDPAALAGVLAALKETDVVHADVETTGLDPRTDRVRLLSLAADTIDGGSFTYLVDCFACDPSPLWPALAERRMVFHNALFDLQMLAGLGFTPGEAGCTLLMSQVLNAGAKGTKHGLKDCARRELGLELDKAEQKSDWSGALRDEQLCYAAADVQTLRSLHQALAKKIDAGKLLDTVRLEERCLPAVLWMASKGVAIDRTAWRALGERARAEATLLKDRLEAMAPDRPGELFARCNWDSPKDVKEAFALLGVTLESTDDDALAACPHPLAALVREYRAAEKLVSTYGEKWEKHIAPDGRVYAGWRQCGTITGRMASGGPNMQNVPRKKDYRRCFTAPPGRALVKADYSQIELRIAARIARERNMLEAYRRGDDLHTMTARSMTGKAEVSAEERQMAKPVNFGMIYGLGAASLKAKAKAEYGLDVTEADARKYRDAFFRAYPGIESWHQQIRQGQATETRTLTGRRVLVEADGFYGGKANYAVQGTGGDGIKIALALLWERRHERPDAFPVLAVHDEIVVECDEGEAEVAAAWLRQAMLDAMAPLLAPVPVDVEVKVGATWGG